MSDRLERHTPSKISVLIVDDHPVFRDGLQRVFEGESDIRVVGQSPDGEKGLEAARQLHPDVVILDINLPVKNGLQVARQLKTERNDVAIVVLIAHHDAEQVLHAMRAGASAYCPKDIMPDRLVEVIRETAAGYYIVGGERMDESELQAWITNMVEAITGPYMTDANEHFVPLSPREMEILQFVTRGLSNKEIASRLRISQQTVKNHMTSILKKLNVQDRTQAAVTALRHGWVRIHDDNLDDNTSKTTVHRA